MKKILFILIFFELILFSLLGIQVLKNNSINKLMYDNQTLLLLRFENPLKYSKGYGDYLNKLGEKYDVTFSKYVHTDENNIVIYSSNISLRNNILIDGKVPRTNTEEYICNKNKNDKLQVGTFSLFDSTKTISIKSIVSSKNIAGDGIYYVGTQDSKVIENIIADLNKNVAKTTFIDRTNKIINTIADLIQINVVLISNILLVSIVLFVSIILYTLKKSKTIGVLRLNGYTCWNVIKELCLDLKYVLFSSFLSSYIISMIYYISFNRLNYIGMFLCIYLFFISLVLLIIFFTISISVYFQIRFGNILSFINGKKHFKLINFINLLIKLCFLVYFIISINQLTVISKSLALELQSLSRWDNAKNIYRTVVSDTGKNDFKKEKDVNKKAKKFYDSMKSKGGFFIDADKYLLMGNGQHVYDMNSTGNESSFTANGKSISVDENYLKRNKITIDGDTSKVFEEIIKEDNVYNVLVPQKLKDKERNIYNSFLDDFYFKKVEVPNMYAKELKEEKSKIKKSDLKVNIIYVDNNQPYFTYDSQIMAENSNTIIDPIVIVDTGNIEDGYYYSCLTRCYFFPSESLDAYGYIDKNVNDADLLNSIPKVESIYDQKGKRIQDLKEDQYSLSMTSIILFISNLVMIYNLIASYYEKNKYNLYIKKIFGFGILRRSYLFYSIILGMNILTIAVLAQNKLTILISIIFFLIECICIFVFDKFIMNKTVNSILKGEH